MDNRPVGRKKNVNQGGSGVHKTGKAGGGSVGSGHRPGGGSGGSQRPSGSSGGDNYRRSGGSRSPMGLGAIVIVIIIAIFAFRACSGGGGSSSGSSSGYSSGGSSSGYSSGSSSSGSSSSGSSLFDMLLGSDSSDYGSYMSGNTAVSSNGWEGGETNLRQLDTTVASGARAKRTQIVGGGKDVVTIMVYLCGTDLESRSAMATKDMQEMLNATVSDKINLIIYTGGCKKWQNNVVSSQVNQIYQIQGGKMARLKSDAGTGAMTDPSTLSSFLKWGAKNFPADRYDLIFWDHGGGSNTGYGYDEKNPRAGAMSLAGINTALKDSGITFDMVGFDTCLMATVETALVVSQYADYMVASEETEPGVGWYYTDWLTTLSENTSIPTLELGQVIVDSFVNTCAKTCSGQSATLSVTDLAELEKTVPQAMSSFAKSASEMIEENEYQTLSSARGTTREFATSSKIDQIDLVHLAKKLNTTESNALADALLGAVKYNNVSRGMTNAYGLSVYFPYQKMSKVDSMVNTYEAIGMDDDYTKCIQEFASLSVGGQYVASQSGSSATSIFGQLAGMGSSSSSGGSSTAVGQDMISQLLGQLLSGSVSGVSGLDATNSAFLGRSLDVETASAYLAANQFDSGMLAWSENSAGDTILTLSEEQWSLVQNLDLSMYYDDGQGYLEMGLDNVFEFDEEGNLLAPTDRTWVAIDGQIVAYYRVSTAGTDDDYTIMGRVPAELNGDRVNLILVFDTDHPDGYVAGAVYDYVDGETEAVAKNLTELEQGDEVRFLCDYYDYDGNFEDVYYLGDPMTIQTDMSEMVVDNRDVGDDTVLLSYRFTDIYNQEYWTPVLADMGR